MMADQTEFARSPLTTVHRLPQRAQYDKETVNSILDEAFLCHLSYVNDDG
jgi:nitroimidazol reductase NimA-like FMN-containing flavoprotein (pyridoxamine 5'-phosphate oxidase superfamily)